MGKSRNETPGRVFCGVLTCIFVAFSASAAHAAFIFQLTQDTSITASPSAPFDSIAINLTGNNVLSPTDFFADVNTTTALGTGTNGYSADHGRGDVEFAAGPYSMTLVASIARPTTAEPLTVVGPGEQNMAEPVTLTLFGTGLLAIVVATAYRRRRQRASLSS